MKIDIQTTFSDSLKENEIEVYIKANKNSNELNKIIENIQNISENIDTIIGTRQNNIFIINISDIISFYSKQEGNFCKTANGEFRIKKKLYDLEENLDKDTFVRISNSCIINIKYVESFDLSMIGNIIVKFTDETSEYVSKRRIPYVMKFLRERGK